MTFYRGFENRPDIGTIINTRKDRKPKDLDIEIHNEADKVFFKMFEKKFRSQSVFCTGDISIAEAYGEVATIKPIGSYVICWSSKCKDFIEIKRMPDLTVNEFILEMEYQIGNETEALKSGNEIMLFCDQYKILSHE